MAHRLDICALAITLPFGPLSLNNAYSDQVYKDKRTGRYRARRFLTAEGKRFKANVGHYVRQAAADQGWWWEPTYWIEALLRIYFDANRQDLGNSEKLVTDAAGEVLGFNDNRVVDLHLSKRFTDGDPWMEFTLLVLPASAITRPKKRR